MGNTEVVGRKEEQETLKKFFESAQAEFLAIYGRRRVGKTFLITQFFAEKEEGAFFYTTGIKNAHYKKQIGEFTKIVGKVFYQGAELKPKASWLETFELLTAAFKNIPENKKIVLFMDEFPWMATKRSGLLQALDYYWNRYWIYDKRIKLIICGSSASWVINKIIHHKGGLHNRVTYQVNLETFNLKETKEYLEHKGIQLSHAHLLQIYMVMGGVPFYLSKVEWGLSAAQIIERLAFRKKSLLLEEFDNLFSSLFEQKEIYVRTVRWIAQQRYGISQKEILGKLGKPMRGFGGLKILDDLEKAGFIISFKPHFHKKKGVYYRIADEYISFYLDWIEPIKNTLLNRSLANDYWEKQQTSSTWYSWAGYAFEAICYKHLSQIRKALGLNSSAIPNTWRYNPRKGEREQGAQIDLLFDREDNSITICEIKHSHQPFEIDKSYATELINKVEVFKKITRTRKQIFLAMISANGLKPTMYSEELISGLVSLDDLFQS